tara:strand:+ start:1130 stop:1273 length:144 start_codon:yes stop_codon:yes gene_type:complete
MSVARELGYTLSDLVQKITIEELNLWSIYFELYNEEQDAEIKRTRYR